MTAVGISAAAIKIPGATNQAALEIEIGSKNLIAKIAAAATKMVSMSRDASSRFDLLSKNEADSIVGRESAILSWLKG